MHADVFRVKSDLSNLIVYGSFNRQDFNVSNNALISILGEFYLNNVSEASVVTSQVTDSDSSHNFWLDLTQYFT